MLFAEERGPCCALCKGASTRAARTRQLIVRTEAVYYLAYLWSCSVCGNRWVDDALERLNACAEQSARRAS